MNTVIDMPLMVVSDDHGPILYFTAGFVLFIGLVMAVYLAVWLFHTARQAGWFRWQDSESDEKRYRRETAAEYARLKRLKGNPT